MDLINNVNDLDVANSSEYSFLESLNVDASVLSRLTSHLNRIKLGSDVILTTPFSQTVSADEFLSGWDVIFNSKSNLMNQTLIDLEVSNRDKYGPRSIAKSWTDRIDSVEQYFSNRNIDSTLSLKNLRLPKCNLRPLSIENAAKYLKSSTNSGLPYYTKKGIVRDRVVHKYDYLLSRRDPCILFTRTQEGGKTRNVWGYPIVDTLEETRFYQPLLDYQSRLNWRAALRGPVHVDKCITELIKRADNNNYSILSVDYTAYDASVTNDLIDAAFNYIGGLFQSEFRGSLFSVKDRFKTIGLVTPSGVTSGSHGVPSGSTFTNEVDSLVQYLLAKSCDFDDESLQIQGDDGVVIGSEESLKNLITVNKRNGLNMNESKSHISKDYAVYLQNLYHKDYTNNGLIGGIYPTYRALCRLFFQERWSDFERFDLDGIDYYSIRAITILENCRNHPLFEDLVRYVYSHDKYNLAFSKKSISKFDAMITKGPGTGGFLKNQYGDDVKGINKFETVKLLNKLRKGS